jgi:4-hydroxythreonine-4-phosphate dehydrogenase
MGDPNGVGTEVIIKSLMDKRMTEICTPIIFGSSKLLSHTKKNLNLSEFNFHVARDMDQIRDNKVNVIQSWKEEFQVNYGSLDPKAGEFARSSLDACIEVGKKGIIDAIVTAPISKYSIQSEDFNFPGHTEYLAQHFSENKENLMILASGDLRVALCTGHLPLGEVADAIQSELIESKIKLLGKSLRYDFGIRKPKIAVLALNPHAGDNGRLGSEEKEVIQPAIEKFKDEKILVHGPFAADGFFGRGDQKKYDGILAMYHDQGLAPFKALAFGSGVNFTAGMDIVRTSPDHGTAMDIAGQGIAEERSMREAIYFALDRVRTRNGEKELLEQSMVD